MPGAPPAGEETEARHREDSDKAKSREPGDCGDDGGGGDHCCAPPGGGAGVAIPFVGFPAATSGTYVHAFDLTDPAVYIAGFLAANGGTAAGAEPALIAGLETVNAYANIHDAIFPGGEISGWFRAVPEPTSLVLLASALFGLGLTRRRSRG